jgi:hypothetical protein
MNDTKYMPLQANVSLDMKENSIVSDKVMNKVDDLVEANRMIGQLEGEKTAMIAKAEAAEKEWSRKLEEAETIATVEFASGGGTSTTIGTDRWGYAISTTTNNPQKVDSIKVNKGDLSDLADAAVKGQAKKDVEKAEKEAKAAKDALELMQKRAVKDQERHDKEINDAQKSLKKSIEAAVERETKQNKKEINELTLELKASKQEADLLVDERDNLSV